MKQNQGEKSSQIKKLIRTLESRIRSNSIASDFLKPKSRLYIYKKNLLYKFIERSKDFIIITDDIGKVLYANPAAIEVCDVSKEDLLTKNIFKWLNPYDEEESKKLKKELLKKGYIINHTFDIVTKTGENVHTEMNIVSIKDSQEKIIGFGAVIRDITAQRNMKQNLIQSDKKYEEEYKKINFYKELLAHDIANILNNIGLGIEYAEVKKRGEDFPKVMEDIIELIKTQLKNKKKLISNIRKISNIQEEKISLLKVNCLTILKDILQNNALLNQKCVSVSIEQLTDNSQVIAGPFLKDVFENVLTNAIQHNQSKNPWVKIRIRNFSKYNKPYIKFEFIDNGIGIPNELKKKIFSRRYKTKRPTSGMGIGLSLVYNIVEVYEGDIWVENRHDDSPEKGSIFTLILPRA